MIFLDMTPKAKAIKAKISQRDYFKKLLKSKENYPKKKKKKKRKKQKASEKQKKLSKKKKKWMERCLPATMPWGETHTERH